MKNSTVIIVAFILTTGLILYGIIDNSSMDSINERENQVEENKGLMGMEPEVIKIADKQILCIPDSDYNYRQNRLKVNYEFYSLHSDTLKRIIVQ